MKPSTTSLRPTAIEGNRLVPFVFCLCGGGLLALALERFLVALSPAQFLHLPDPLIEIPLRLAVVLAGLMELLVALMCLRGKNSGRQLMMLAWLAIIFVVYEIALFSSGCRQTWTALGSLTDPLQLSRRLPGGVLPLLPLYLLLGCVAAVLAPKLVKRLKTMPRLTTVKVGRTDGTETATNAPDPKKAVYVRFLKIACVACGGRIEFPTNFFGEQIPCPHCQTAITLQKGVNLKMNCSACEGHIEFPSHGLGQKIPCPHCHTEITLEKPAERPDATTVKQV